MNHSHQFWHAAMQAAMVAIGFAPPRAGRFGSDAWRTNESRLDGPESDAVRRAAGDRLFEFGLAAVVAVVEHEAHRPDVAVLAVVDAPGPSPRGRRVVPVRVRLGDDPSCAEVVAVVRAAVDDVRRSPPPAPDADAIVTARGTVRSTAVLYALDDGSAPQGALQSDPVAAAADCVVRIVDSGRLRVRVEHRAGTFDDAAAERIAAQVARALAEFATRPESRLADVDLLGEVLRREVLEASRGPAGPAAREPSVPDRVAELARAHPSAIAIVEDGRSVTYAELLASADALAEKLRALGTAPGDVVPVIGRRSADVVASWLGVMRAGAAYAPIDPTQPPSRIATMVEACKPRVTVAEPAIAATLGGAAVCVGLAEAPAAGARSSSPPGPRGDLAYVIFTSGSSGRPKGVEVGHDALAHLAAWLRRRLALTDADHATLISGLGFDVAAGEAWSALTAGAALHIPPEDVRIAPERLRDWMVERRLTVAFAPTILAEALLQLSWPAAGPLRILQTAGEALRRRPRPDHRFELINLYGPTEFTVFATSCVVAPAGEDPPPIGMPLDDTTAYVVDHRGRLCAHGVRGELWLAGTQIARGYRGAPGLTASSFVETNLSGNGTERAYRTGDLVRRRSDGTLEFTGRRDGQFKLRGLRIEPGEVETALVAHPAVGACIVSLDETPGAERIAAFVEVSDPSRPPSGDELAAWLESRLPRAMIPSRWVIVPMLPRSPNGKIDRGALAALPASEPETAAAEPLDEIERAVADIFGDLVGTRVASRDADLFRLGGSSLHAVRLSVACRARFGVAVDVSALLARPTVGATADLVRDARAKPAAAGAVPKVARGVPSRMSPQQRALWLDAMLHPGSDVYNEALAFRVSERLDEGRFRRALRRLAQRHEVLRARLTGDEVEPLVAFDLDPDAIEFDAAEAPSAEAAERDLEEAASRPFHLSKGPMWRARIRTGPGDETAIVFVAHHLIIDAASQSIVLRELAEIYRDPDAKLAVRAHDFADIAATEHESLRAGMDSLQRHWAETLAGADLRVDLPAPCVACPPGEEDRGFRVRSAVGADLARRVRDLASAWGTTPFHVYGTAFLALLRVYAGRDDLAVGMPVSTRDLPEADGVVGYLLSPLVLRVRMSAERSFQDSVAEFARAFRSARAHAHLPMDLVIQAAHAERSAVDGAPVQVFFALREPLDLGFEAEHATPIHLSPGHAKFRMFLLVEEDRGGDTFVLEFGRAAIDPDMARRFLFQLDVLLRAATSGPSAPLGSIPVLGRDEEARLIAWGRNERSYPSDASVPGLFEEVARERATAAAIVSDGVEISYAALDRRANSVAAALLAAGVRAGDRVPLLLRRGPRFIACALGVMKAGAVFAPLDPDNPSARLKRMLADIGARVGVREPGDGAAVDDVVWIDASVADSETAVAPAAQRPGPADAAYVMFTSGSSGAPKGITVPHRAIVRLVRGQDFARMGPEESWLHLAPTSFDASTLEIWAPLLNGGRCVVAGPGPLSAAELAALVRREGVTSAWLTASYFNALVDESPACLSGLTQILSGGEALSPQHVRRAMERAPATSFINGYGPTENTTFTCCHAIRPEDVAPDRSVPIGRPVANSTVHVTDPAGRLCPIGVPGELATGGDGVALGYVGLPELTAARFVPDPFGARSGGRLYRTGDRARWRSDGVLEFLGRFDDQVKIRGHRIEPREIAACLEEHLSVGQAVVVPRADSGDGATLVAYVVPRVPGADVDGAALATHAAERLPQYMIPRAFVAIPVVPLTPNGKLDTAALPKPPALRQTPSSAGASPTEPVILAMWRELLAQPGLGPDDDFFAAGGHSLLAVRMLARLERDLGVRLPARVMFEASTPRRFAALVAGMKAGPEPALSSIVRIREGLGVVPLFCLPGVGGHAFQYRELAARMRTERPILALQVHDLDVPAATIESIQLTADAFVARMRAVRPHGPYALTGYSYGGIVALEIARRLTALGETVSFLGLVDTYAPGAAAPSPRLKKIGKHLANLADMRSSREVIAYLSNRVRRRAGRIAFVLREMFDRAGDPKSNLERRIEDTAMRCIRAYYAYEPRPYAGQVTVFRARRLIDWEEVIDPTNTCGWGPICRDVEVVDIDCEHLELFKEPHISELARRLDEALEGVGDGF